METTSRPGTPLRHRMLDDMRMRKFAEHTQAGYIRAVRKLAVFLGRSPDTATTEDLRRFQLHLVDSGTGPVTINAGMPMRAWYDLYAANLAERADLRPPGGTGAAPVQDVGTG